MRTENMVPSVEDARSDYLAWAPEACEPPETVHMRDADCEWAARMIEAASVRLDVAVSLAHRPVRDPWWTVLPEDVATA